MSNENNQIITILIQHLMDNPEERFGQALFNLGINQFANSINSSEKNHLLKDIYNDTGKQILERIKRK